MRNFPIRRFWDAALRRAEPGPPLLPKMYVRDGSRSLLTFLAKIGIEDAGRYSPHCFRMGGSHGYPPIWIHTVRNRPNRGMAVEFHGIR